MSENLFLGDAQPHGYIAVNTTEIVAHPDARTSMPVSVENYNYLKISPVGGSSTRARTVEILKNGNKRWFGDFGVSSSNPMEELLYIVNSDVAAIQIYYKWSDSTCSGLHIEGVGNIQAVYEQNIKIAQKGVTETHERYLGKLELDLDPLSERYAVFDRRTVNPLFHGLTEYYRPIIVPEKYGSTGELFVLMFDDSGEYNIAAADKVQAELFDANQPQNNNNE